MTEKEEYEKFHMPDEYERKVKLIKMGIENAKLRAKRTKRMIEARHWKSTKKELADKYGI